MPETPASAALPVCSRCQRKIITFDGSRPTICGNCAAPRSRLRRFVRAAELPVLAAAPGCFAACWIAGVNGFWLWLLGVTSALLAVWVWPHPPRHADPRL